MGEAWPPALVKSRAFILTTTAGEDETSEDNPENNKRDAADVAPSVGLPAHENEATTEPTTAEPAQRGLVQEFGLTLDNPTDRALSTGHIVNRTENGNCSSWSMLPKRTVCYQQREWQHTRHHAHSGGMEIEQQCICFLPTMKKPLSKTQSHLDATIHSGDGRRSNALIAFKKRQ